MAKVTGPLFSLSASGKIANAMVHFGWKGLNVVREWVIPANPKSGSQGDVRLVLGGLGRSTRCVEKTSLYQDDAKVCAPSDQTWVSYLLQYMIANYMSNATAYEVEYAEYAAHAAKADFDSAGASLNLIEFDLAYKATTNAFVAGLQVYTLAKYGIAMKAAKEDVFDRSPYDTAIASWTATETAELVTDVQAV